MDPHEHPHGTSPPADAALGDEALRRERELLQTIIDSIPVMITLYQPDTKILRINPEFVRITGWSTPGTSLMEQCYPDPEYREKVRRYMESCTPGWRDFRIRTADGRDVETTWANIRLSDGRQVGIGLDISERRRADAALRDSEERFRDLFENANDIIYTADLQGRITSVNKRAEGMIGFTHQEFLERSAWDLAPPEYHAVMQEALRRKLAGESSPTVYEMQVVCKDGRRVPMEISTPPAVARRPAGRHSGHRPRHHRAQTGRAIAARQRADAGPIAARRSRRQLGTGPDDPRGCQCQRAALVG